MESDFNQISFFFFFFISNEQILTIPLKKTPKDHSFLSFLFLGTQKRTIHIRHVPHGWPQGALRVVGHPQRFNWGWSATHGVMTPPNGFFFLMDVQKKRYYGDIIFRAIQFRGEYLFHTFLTGIAIPHLTGIVITSNGRTTK
jgi:hypothetical protein